MIEIDRPEDSVFSVGPESLTAKAAEAVDDVWRTFEGVKAEAYEKAAEVDTFVRARPYAALGLAVLGGMLVAHLLSARRPQVVYLREPRRPLLK